MVNTENVKTSRGVNAVKGKCKKCGTNMYVMLGKVGKSGGESTKSKSTKSKSTKSKSTKSKSTKSKSTKSKSTKSKSTKSKSTK
jgi:hypothetical protein